MPCMGPSTEGCRENAEAAAHLVWDMLNQKYHVMREPIGFMLKIKLEREQHRAQLVDLIEQILINDRFDSF